MNFLCLVHVDFEQYDSMTSEQQDALAQENLDYYNWLVSNGYNVLSSSLHEPKTATVIRYRNSKLSMTDGAYAETKEHIGGFILLRARDRKEALAVAARSPVTHYGAIEVRETHYTEPE